MDAVRHALAWPARSTAPERGLQHARARERERARADARARKSGGSDFTVLRPVLDAHDPTDWRAWDTLATESHVLAVLGSSGPAPVACEGEIVTVVLDRTPFYAESKGQDSDAGRLSGTSVARRWRRRCWTCSGRCPAWSSTRSVSCPVNWPPETRCMPPPPSGGSVHARPAPAPTSCTPPCARSSARAPRSRAPTTAPATSAWTSPGAAPSPPRSAARSRRPPTRPCAATCRSACAG
ncbi:alanine--tRNA ligase-related protein [Streptomyces viridosporus]